MTNLIIADKFNIIKSDNAKLMDISKFSDWINELFTNNLGENSKYNNALIHDFIYTNCFQDNNFLQEFVKVIDEALEYQINKRAKNVIPNIKKGKFNIKNFDIMLSDMLNIIDKINKTLFLLNKHYDNYYNFDYENYVFVKMVFGKSIIYKKALHHIYSKFVDNFVIKQFLNSQMLQLDTETRIYWINFNKFMDNLKPYDPDCYNFYLTNLIKNLDDLFHDEEQKLPINMGYLNEMNIFKKKVKLYENTLYYFSFLDDCIKKNISKSLIKNIITILSSLFSNNSNPLIVLDFMNKNIEHLIHVLDFMNCDENNEYNFKKLNCNMELFLRNCIDHSIKDNIQLSKLSIFLKDFYSINYLHDKTEKYVNLDIKSMFIEKLGTRLNENPEMIKKVCQIIHTRLKKSKEEDEEEMEQNANILKIISYDNKNKDLFQAIYCKYLVLRLLNNSNINYEKKLLHQLQEIEDYTYVKQMLKMVGDVEISKKDLDNFNKIRINQVKSTLPNMFSQDKLNTITFSYNVWDIAINDNILKSNEICFLSDQLKSYLETYNAFYSARYENKRNLVWLLEMGVINLTLNIKGKNYKIKATPYQTNILELFNTTDKISLNNIFNHPISLKIGKDMTQQIINSFIASSLFFNDSDNLIFNTEYESLSTDISLIEYFNNISSYEELLHKKIEKQVAFDREIVLQTNIVHHLKNKMSTIKEIFDSLKISKNITFELTNEFLNKQVDTLMEKECIEFNDTEQKYYNPVNA